MDRLFSARVPNPEGAVLRHWGEHIFTLWVIKSHMINLIGVGFEFPLLFQFPIANCMESHNIIPTPCDKVSASAVPANRVYCIWTATVRAWLVVVPMAWSPVIWQTPSLHLWLYLEVNFTHCTEYVTCILFKWIHLQHLLIIVPSPGLRRYWMPPSTFHFMMFLK